MAGLVEAKTLALVRAALDIHEEHPTPSWLMRPGIAECGSRWGVVQTIYQVLGGARLPDTMPARERRRVDAVIETAAGLRIVEIDEAQHFNLYRAATLRAYPPSVEVGFDRTAWIAASEAKGRLEAGGFARPCPPLFPGEGGRHRQRAFRDALCDTLPAEHGWRPTLRIAHFEVESWLGTPDAKARMYELLTAKGVT